MYLQQHARCCRNRRVSLNDGSFVAIFSIGAIGHNSLQSAHTWRLYWSYQYQLAYTFSSFRVRMSHSCALGRLTSVYLYVCTLLPYIYAAAAIASPLL